jgi:Phage Mu protein F like protein
MPRLGVSASRAHALLDRLSFRLQGPMRRAFTRAMDTMVAKMDVSQVEALLARGDVGGAVRAVLDAGEVSAKSVLRTQFSTALDAGARLALTQGANKLSGTHMVNLIAGSPRAAKAMARLELQFFPPVFQDTEAVLRSVYATGLAEGVNPRTVARSTREFVGITSYDHSIIQSYELDLRSGNLSNALGRTLRDARYDRTLRDALATGRRLGESEVKTMAGRYTERLVKWRAETWSRSATLNAAKESQLVAWQEAADASGFDEGEVVKTWITQMDGKERPEHHDMNEETVPIDETFSNGQTIPGEDDYNCRCTFTVRVLPASKQSRDAFFSRFAQDG